MSGADRASNSMHPWAGNLVSISLVNGRNMQHKKLLLKVGVASEKARTARK
jgi:hypothetical protein